MPGPRNDRPTRLAVAMSPFTQNSRSRLSQQFADIFQEAQEEYRTILTDLRDDDVDPVVFAEQVEAFRDRLLKLKRIRLQLRHERDELIRLSGKDEVA